MYPFYFCSRAATRPLSASRSFSSLTTPVRAALSESVEGRSVRQQINRRLADRQRAHLQGGKRRRGPARHLAEGRNGSAKMSSERSSASPASVTTGNGAHLVVSREVLVLETHAAAGALGDREAIGVDLASQLEMDTAEDRTALGVLEEGGARVVSVMSCGERVEGGRTIRIEAVISWMMSPKARVLSVEFSAVLVLPCMGSQTQTTRWPEASTSSMWLARKSSTLPAP
jgi:hypothetical protein